MNFPGKLLGAATAAAMMLASNTALAHAQLVQSAPTADAVIASPRTLTLTFSEKLVPAFSTLELMMVEHRMTVPLTVALSEDGKTLTGTPARPLHAGAYRVNWKVAGSDGHVMTGAVDVRVR